MNVIYLRVSTEEQDPQHQLRDVLSVAPEDSKVFMERQSAWKDGLRHRAEFSKVMELIRAGKVDGLFVWDTDRIYRRRVQFIEFWKYCLAKGVRVVSYRQQYLSEFEKIPPPWNEVVRDLMLQILGFMAEEESNKKSERVKKAFKNHKGAAWGRPTLPDAVVERIVRLRKEGFTMRAIQKEIVYKTKDGRTKRPSLGKISEVCE